MFAKHNINETILDNGLAVFHVRVPSNDVSIIANVNAGPVYETDSTAGISHLIEHLLFKGTKRRTSRDMIYNELKLLGGNDFCYTQRTNIPLGMRVVLKDFDQALDLISDILFHSKMSKVDIEKEKKIVLDELRSRHDDTRVHLWDKLYESLFKGCALARSGGGYPHTVESLSIEDVVEFYKKMFNPSNTTLFVVGPKEFCYIIEKIRKYFSQESGQNYPTPSIKIPENKAKKVTVVQKLEDVHLMMGRIVPSFCHDDSYALKVVGSAISRAVSEKILDKEPISYERWVSYYADKITGTLVACATCDRSKYERVRELIYKELERIKSGEIPVQHIKDIINAEQKRFVLENATTMDIAKNLLDFWLKGNVRGFNNHITKLKALKNEDVFSAARKYVRTNDFTEVFLGSKAS